MVSSNSESSNLKVFSGIYPSMIYTIGGDGLAGKAAPPTSDYLGEFISLPAYITMCANMSGLLKVMKGDADPRLILDVMIACVERTEKSQKCNLSNVKHCLLSWRDDLRKFINLVQYNECNLSMLSDNSEYLQISRTMIDDGSSNLCPLDDYIKDNLYPYAMYATWKDILYYIDTEGYSQAEVQMLINFLLQYVVHKPHSTR